MLAEKQTLLKLIFPGLKVLLKPPKRTAGGPLIHGGQFDATQTKLFWGFFTGPDYCRNPKSFADLGSDEEDRPRLSPKTDLVLVADGLEPDRPTFRQDFPTVPRVLFDFTPLCIL